MVDDDPVVLRALRRLLLGARPTWQIDTADCGAAALERIEHTAYDVVTTDLHMPGVDGVTLLGRLKTEQPAVRRVIHSSHVESLRGEHLLSLAHAVLNKPSRPEELLRVLDWAVDQRQERLRDSAGF
jgi:CheY-like chemotaxis protein